MGDRLAVMRAGRVEQCGVPIDVYDHPCNLFVAQFVGTPTMNVCGASVVESADDRAAHRPAPDRRSTTISCGAGRSGGGSSGATSRSACGPRRSGPTRTDGWSAASVRRELVERRKWVDVRPRCTGGDRDRRRRRRSIPPLASCLVAAVDPDLPVGLWEPFRVTLDLDRVHLFDLATGHALD